MKRLLSVLFFALWVSALSAQKTINDPNAEKRNVSGYHGIEVSGGIDLYLSYGDESVAVSASETKYRDNIKTEVEHGILKIWYDHRSNFSLGSGNRKLKAYVSYKNLDKLRGSGGSDISVEGTIKTNSLELQLSGGSDFRGKSETGELKIDASGGSDVDISGRTGKLEIGASGGSNVRGYELSTDICNVQASGGCDIYITVNKELHGTASGGSDIFYKGTGTVNEIKSSGSSSIKKTSR